MLEIGAFPFLIKKGKLYIMIVSSTSGKSWILPKGHPEDKLKHSQVAALESYEEAGIKGLIFNRKLGKEFKQKKEALNLLIYPLLITKILNKWQEESIRKRQLVTINKALTLVTKKEHLQAIKYFSSNAMFNKLSKANKK
ncbi:MAG: NUDIX hydrolase [Gammaproteobacteria bacterium]|nr:NUDIX hydrolase [Gammaproteobacteria bacterium]